MNRRRLVLLVSAVVLGSILFVAGISVLVVTSTDYGRNNVVRPLVHRVLRGAIHGNVYLGHITSGFLTSVSVDSFAIRDGHGELMVSTGPVTVSYDPRDIADQRILIHAARLEHPYLHLIQHKTGVWNFQEIFPPSKGPPRPRTSPREITDYMVFDSVAVRNGTVQLTLPWDPDDSLHGAALDSSIKVALARTDKIIRRAPDGFSRTYQWTQAFGFFSHIRLADPDSNRFGRIVRVDTLNVNEFEPPFNFRRVNGEVKLLGDSVFFNAPHFDLPASTGSGHGHIWWGHDLPVRLDIAIRGDSVALNDVAWVYPTLPRTGGGTMQLAIRNEGRRCCDFKLHNMDVRSTKSRLIGDMTFGTGAPLLLVHDVDLRADPIDFDLVRALAGHPFPVDWQGQIYGTARGPGGPLDRFVINDAQATWRDTHVPGAVSRGGGHGELDIRDPAVTAFHHFDVNVGQLDLRSVEYLFPSFLRLGGYVSGTATLDSSWLDVRFSNAHIAHQDGPGAPSQFTGEGRVTYGADMTYDVAANAEPLSLSMLARSYPKMPLRGLVAGPVRLQGTTKDLATTTSLQGDAGSISFQGRLNLDSAAGYGAHGQGQFGNIDFQQLLEKPSIKPGALNGHFTVDLSDISMARTSGSLDLGLDRSRFDSLAILPSVANVRFDSGKVRVDTLRLNTLAGRVTADGAIGMPSGTSDSLSIEAVVDSLGGLRSYVGHPDTSITRDEILPDSLSGDLHFRAVARGRLDSLSLRGRVTGSGLYARRSAVNALSGTFDLDHLWKRPTGLIALHADSASIGWVKVDTADARLRLAGLDSGGFSVGVSTANGQSMSAAGYLAIATASGGASVRLDSASFYVNRDRWRLVGGSDLRVDSTGVDLDSLTLVNADSARVTAKISAPRIGPAGGILQATAVPLADIEVALQLSDTVVGRTSGIATIGGTSDAPVITTTGEMRDIRSGSVQLERIAGSGEYRDNRFNGAGDIFAHGRAAVHATASLPVAVSLFSARRLPDSLHITFRADSADLGIVQGVLPVDSTSGRVKADLDIGGTWGTGVVPTGEIVITNGAMSLSRFGDQRISDIEADVRFHGRDSMIVKELSASSDAGPKRNSLSISGSVSNYLDSTAHFDLAILAHQFHVETPGVAKLNLSTTAAGRETPVTLRGTLGANTLSGPVTIDAGQILLPDPVVAQKTIVEFDTSTTRFGNSVGSGLLQQFMQGLIPAPSLTITLSDQVRLQSQDADIPLSGSLGVVKVNNPNIPNPSFFTRFGLAPQGQLSANSGRYRLNLGVVRREFAVQPGGKVVFDGNLPLNPQIDLKALYVVRQNGKPDVNVYANVDGYIDPGPSLSFSSDQTYLSQSDLVSYLVAGQPGFLGDNPDVARTVFQFLGPTLSSLAQDQLTQSISGLPFVGPLLQQRQFQLQFQGGYSGPVNASGEVAGTQAFNANTLGSSLSNYLYGSSIGGQVQLTDRLALGLSAGLCYFSPKTGGQNGVQLSPGDVFSGQLRYRLGASSTSYSLQAGREPSTQARYCQSGVTGVITAPTQWSLALSKFWRF